jgi:hypothetical protein
MEQNNKAAPTDAQIEAKFAAIYFHPGAPGNELLQRVYPIDLVAVARKLLADAATPAVPATAQVQSNLIETLKFALQDALGFAELIEAMSKPDVEIYKHELRGDSERAQQRLNVALQAIEDAEASQPQAEQETDQLVGAMYALRAIADGVEQPARCAELALKVIATLAAPH